jgi:hypothetical protein
MDTDDIKANAVGIYNFYEKIFNKRIGLGTLLTINR